jgi:hypothetical protein
VNRKRWEPAADREQVLAVALGLLDEARLEQLTMPAWPPRLA